MRRSCMQQDLFYKIFILLKIEQFMFFFIIIISGFLPSLATLECDNYILFFSKLLNKFEQKEKK